MRYVVRMDTEQIVKPGKIVTIVFKGPSKRPLHIAVKNGKSHSKTGVVYISSQTPLAQAIINHKAGDNIEFNSPEGKLRIRIIGISI